LLQTIEDRRSGEFKQGPLGYYYQFMLAQAFQIAGVMPESLTELFQYFCQLAWYFHGRSAFD
jgi:hypothetical protein